MAFQPVEDGIEVVVRGTMGSIPFYNVFGVSTGGSFTSGIATAIADILDDAYDAINGNQKTSFAVNDYLMTDVRTETGNQFTIGSTIAGTSSGEALPFQTAALISWQTGTRGRSYRGRTYLGGFVEGTGDGRSIASGLITDLDAFATVIKNAGIFGIISRFSGTNEDGKPIPRETGIITTITSYTVHGLWRTQRRRALLDG